MPSLEEDLRTLCIYSKGLSLADVKKEETETTKSRQQTASDKEAEAEDEKKKKRPEIKPADLPILAERVYGLLKQELRLERERLA